MERDDKPKLLNRLNRIEGQVRGVARMIEEDRYCIEILTQMRALKAALSKVENEVLKTHREHCVVGAMASGDPAEQRRKADELIELLDRTR